jgi:hypothetical protein
VLAWRIVAPFDGAFIGKALFPFEEKLLAFTAALTASRVEISCHVSRLL